VTDGRTDVRIKYNESVMRARIMGGLQLILVVTAKELAVLQSCRLNM